MQNKIFFESNNISPRLYLLKEFTDSISRDVEELSNHLHELTQNQSGNESTRSLKEQMREYEEQIIRNALLKSGGNQARAAKLLKIKSTTLNAKIKRIGISLENLLTFSSNNGKEKPD
jgi:transcriptional regulator with PAS, ATPase and Fis domain